MKNWISIFQIFSQIFHFWNFQKFWNFENRFSPRWKNIFRPDFFNCLGIFFRNPKHVFYSIHDTFRTMLFGLSTLYFSKITYFKQIYSKLGRSGVSYYLQNSNVNIFKLFFENKISPRKINIFRWFFFLKHTPDRGESI